MNYGRNSWSPLRFNMVCFSPENETGSTPAASTPSDSGGTSPPAVGDSSTPTETPSSSSSSDPFAGFENDDLDFLEIGDDATGTDPGATPPSSEPTPAPAIDPKAPPVVPTPAATPDPKASVEPAPAAPSAPRTAREELDAAVGDMKGNFAELSNWASTELFSLTQEESDALETDAVTMIPKLMARTYTQAIMAATNIMRNFTPRLIQEGFVQQQASSARSNEAKTEFYKAFPELNEAAHGTAFTQWAKMFRQMNPKASRAEAIEFVGNALMSQFKLQRGAKAPGATPAPGKVPPFQPARPGARQVAQVPVDDPYAGMDQDFLSDDS